MLEHRSPHRPLSTLHRTGKMRDLEITLTRNGWKFHFLNWKIIWPTKNLQNYKLEVAYNEKAKKIVGIDKVYFDVIHRILVAIITVAVATT